MSIEERIRKFLLNTNRPTYTATLELARSLDELRERMADVASRAEDAMDGVENLEELNAIRDGIADPLESEVKALEERVTDMGRTIDGLSARLGGEIVEARNDARDQGFELTDRLESPGERLDVTEEECRAWSKVQTFGEPPSAPEPVHIDPCWPTTSASGYGIVSPGLPKPVEPEPAYLVDQVREKLNDTNCLEEVVAIWLSTTQEGKDEEDWERIKENPASKRFFLHMAREIIAIVRGSAKPVPQPIPEPYIESVKRNIGGLWGHVRTLEDVIHEGEHGVRDRLTAIEKRMDRMETSVGWAEWHSGCEKP